MKRLSILVLLALVVAMTPVVTIHAQEEGEAAVAEAEAAPAESTSSSEESSTPNQGSGGFLSVILGSGALGIFLWLALFGAAGAGVYFGVDCAITVREKRIMPQQLIDIADPVTEMKEIKHPYEKGIKAQKGIEF